MGLVFIFKRIQFLNLKTVMPTRRVQRELRRLKPATYHPQPHPNPTPFAKSLPIKGKLRLNFLQNMERNIILALLDSHYSRKEDF